MKVYAKKKSGIVLLTPLLAYTIFDNQNILPQIRIFMTG